METIDINTWPRRELYEWFSGVESPFYSVTAPLDVTEVKRFATEHGLSFYHTLIWLVTKAVNSVPALKMRIRNGHVVELDATHPSFTSMRAGDEAHRNINVRWVPDVCAFDTEARRISSQQATLFGEDDSDDLLFISCMPWFDFTSLTNVKSGDPDDTVPRIAWGKYVLQDGRLMLHMSVEVNHRLIDGVHLGQFFDALEREIVSLAASSVQ